MNARDFRRIALGLDGAIEKAHMGHPDFRANGRIFATLHADMLFGMVKLTPGEQAAFMKAQPGVFAPEPGAWGRSGCTSVRLDAVDEETLGEAMTLAWQHTGERSKPRPRASSTRQPRASTTARGAKKKRS
jgi:hypothetical protein